MLALVCALFGATTPALAAELSVSATSAALSAGARTTVTVSGASGTVRVASRSPAIATASYASPAIAITGVSAGQTVVRCDTCHSNKL